MPVMTCSEKGKPGYKYGSSGHCYTYTSGNEPSRKKAKRKAILQGTAIAQSTGEKLKLSKDEAKEMAVTEQKRWTKEEAVQWLTEHNLIADIFEEDGWDYNYWQIPKETRENFENTSVEFIDGVHIVYAIENNRIIILCVRFPKMHKPIIKMDKILVKSDEHNTIFGWAYARETKEGKQVVDSSGEFTKAENFEDLELATYAYNLAYRQADRQHDLEPKGYLIESIVFTKEKMEKMGIPEGIIPEAVWMGFYFPDDQDYEEIKKMDHPMFSLYGSVTKEFVEEV